MKIRKIEIQLLGNGAYLARFERDGQAAASFIPRELGAAAHGKNTWTTPVRRVEKWLVTSLQNEITAAKKRRGEWEAGKTQDELIAIRKKKARRQRRQPVAAKRSSSKEDAWVTVTEDMPAIYGSHLLGLEGERIRKSQLKG